MFLLKEVNYSALEEGDLEAIKKSETIATEKDLRDAVAKAGGDAFYDSTPAILDTETDTVYVMDTDDFDTKFKHWTEYYGDMPHGWGSWDKRNNVKDKTIAMFVLTDKMASSLWGTDDTVNKEMEIFAEQWDLPFSLDLFKALRAQHRANHNNWDSSTC